MRVIKNKYNNTNEKIPLHIVCENCNSEFEVFKEELNEGYMGILGCKCPCCGERTEEGCGENLVTIHNLNYPQHYYNFGKGKVLSDEVINEMVRNCVKYLDENKQYDYTTTGTGDTKIFVERYEDTEEYTITVCRGYSETNIPLNY